jgi:hypothetical protein
VTVLGASNFTREGEGQQTWYYEGERQMQIEMGRQKRERDVRGQAMEIEKKSSTGSARLGRERVLFIGTQFSILYTLHQLATIQ